MEVALSRAEAYASDNVRLRSVLSKGSRQQQVVAAQNLADNVGELRKSLDVANARMGDLEQAAAEGRVDANRVAETRRKAKDLEREIEASLGDVKRSNETVPELRAAQGIRRGRGGSGPAPQQCPNQSRPFRSERSPKVAAGCNSPPVPIVVRALQLVPSKCTTTPPPLPGADLLPMTNQAPRASAAARSIRFGSRPGPSISGPSVR